MSRAYRVKIPLNLTNLEVNKNQVKMDINILAILDKKRMAEIMRKILTQLSDTEQNGETVKVKTESGIIYEIDLANMTLSIDFSEKMGTVSLDIYEESLNEQLKDLAKNETIHINEENIQNLNDHSKTLIDREISKLKTEAEKDTVTESFKARQFINQVLKEVYKEAIKEKAQGMGNINSITEADENGEYRVRMIID